jgi:hypothetical protein
VSHLRTNASASPLSVFVHDGLHWKKNNIDKERVDLRHTIDKDLELSALSTVNGCNIQRGSPLLTTKEIG